MPVSSPRRQALDRAENVPTGLLKDTLDQNESPFVVGRFRCNAWKALMLASSI